MSAPMTLVADRTQTLDLSAPADNIKTWTRDDLSGVNTVRSRFTVRRVSGKKTPGAFMIELRNGGGDTLSVYAFGSVGKSELVPVVTHSANPKDKPCFAGTAMFSMFSIGETVELEIGWSPNGEVEVLLRDKASRSINNDAEKCQLTLVGGPPTSLLVSAISGRAEWAPLTLGMVQRAAP